jgi:hypothetical protein
MNTQPTYEVITNAKLRSLQEQIDSLKTEVGAAPFAPGNRTMELEQELKREKARGSLMHDIYLLREERHANLRKIDMLERRLDELTKEKQ